MPGLRAPLDLRTTLPGIKRSLCQWLFANPSRTGQAKRRGVDASHAWVAVYCPGFDFPWLELDPTNDAIVNEDYLVLAYGRDFGDVSPFRGVIHAAGGHDLQVAVTVEALSGV